VSHPSDLELDAFLNRTASAIGLADVGGHLANCAECRARLSARSNVEGAFAALYRQVVQTPSEEHLTEEAVQVLAEGGLSPDEEAHLARCSSCRAEVEDLKKFIASRRRPGFFRPRYWIPVAAAIVVAISIVAWRQIQSGPRLPAEYSALVKQVKERQRLEIAPVVGALKRTPEQLLGEPLKGSGFVLMDPVREATLTDRPRFSWSPRTGASTYRVDVYDQDFRKVAESPQIASPWWSPAQAFEPGHTYSWTVTARVGKEEIREPSPPVPEARFIVLGADDAARLRDAAQKYPNDHLLLAALYAQAGVIDEARRELKRLAEAEPDSDVPRRLENSLDGRQ